MQAGLRMEMSQGLLHVLAEVHLHGTPVLELQKISCQIKHLSFHYLACHHLLVDLRMLVLPLQMHKQLETQSDLHLHLDLRRVRKPHQQPLQYVNRAGLLY